VRETNTDLPLSNDSIIRPKNLFVSNKALLDSLYFSKKDSESFKFQDLYITLIIGHVFAHDQKHAILRYKENDTIANVKVLRLNNNFYDTIFSIRLFPVNTGALGDLIQIQDYNGDKIPDLKIVKEFWDIHPGDISLLWIYNRDRFQSIKGFEKIISAQYDEKTNLIYSYRSRGCADMSMYFGIFKIVGRQVKKIKEMNCDCCVEEGDSCKIEILGKRSFYVPYKTAYEFVPAYYAEGVKEKCDMNIKK
jgi:hypothetical protein